MLREKVLLKDRKTNCLRFRKGETFAHALRKLEVCYWLQKNGYDYYTEAEFDSGGRADIAVIHPIEFIIEVLHSEKDESILKKKRLYPIDDIRTTRTSEKFNEKQIL
jgi:hypothetical protein